MRKVQASVAKAKLAELLRDVERGDTRNRKKVAALVPIEDEERKQRRLAVERFKEARSGWKPTGISVEEFMDWRHEGRR